jgi:hypothetical protein
MSKTAFEAKLSNFKNRFKSLLGAKAQVSGRSGRSVAIGAPRPQYAASPHPLVFLAERRAMTSSTL